MTDVLRRAGRFADAIAEVDAGLAAEPDERIRSVLEWQRELSSAGDVRGYSLAQLDSRGRNRH